MIYRLVRLIIIIMYSTVDRKGLLADAMLSAVYAIVKLLCADSIIVYI